MLEPFQMITVDYVGPFEGGYLLITIDNMTGFAGGEVSLQMGQQQSEY